MQKNDVRLVAMFVAALLALFVLVAVVACNPSTGSSNDYYPHDSTHGYYDTHHHYHYYHKYGSGKVYKAPKSTTRRGSSGHGWSKSRKR